LYDKSIAHPLQKEKKRGDRMSGKLSKPEIPVSQTIRATKKLRYALHMWR
jgi:hypothetical protein